MENLIEKSYGKIIYYQKILRIIDQVDGVVYLHLTPVHFDKHLFSISIRDGVKTVSVILSRIGLLKIYPPLAPPS